MPGTNDAEVTYSPEPESPTTFSFLNPLVANNARSGVTPSASETHSQPSASNQSGFAGAYDHLSPAWSSSYMCRLTKLNIRVASNPPLCQSFTILILICQLVHHQINLSVPKSRMRARIVKGRARSVMNSGHVVAACATV